MPHAQRLHPPWSLAGVGLLCAALTGCASLSEQECRTADWRELGFADGRNGQPRARLAAHAEACAELGIRPDQGAYLAGRDMGLKQFCTIDSAIELGLRGGYYHEVCPPDTSQAFHYHYRLARDVYEQTRSVDNLEGRRRSLEIQLDKSKDDKERRRIRDELSDIDHRLRRERSELGERSQRLYGR